MTREIDASNVKDLLLSAEQLAAIRRLWDATNEFTEIAHEEHGLCREHTGVHGIPPSGCEDCKPELIRARDAMQTAFPADHLIYKD